MYADRPKMLQKRILNLEKSAYGILYLTVHTMSIVIFKTNPTENINLIFLKSLYYHFIGRDNICVENL